MDLNVVSMLHVISRWTPKSYWAEAIATAACLRNRIPIAAMKKDKTPYKQWYWRKSNIST